MGQTSKSESLLLSRKVNAPIHPPIFMNNQLLTGVISHKHLGLQNTVHVTYKSSILKKGLVTN